MTNVHRVNTTTTTTTTGGKKKGANSIIERIVPTSKKSRISPIEMSSENDDQDLPKDHPHPHHHHHHHERASEPDSTSDYQIQELLGALSNRFQRRKTEIRKSVEIDLERSFTYAMNAVKKHNSKLEKEYESKLSGAKRKLSQLLEERQEETKKIRVIYDEAKESLKQGSLNLEKNQEQIQAVIDEFLENAENLIPFIQEEGKKLETSIQEDFELAESRLQAKKSNNNPADTVKKTIRRLFNF